MLENAQRVIRVTPQRPALGTDPGTATADVTYLRKDTTKPPATDVVTEVLSTGLTDVIRERLGESYSPYAFALIASDPDPVVETYVQITGSPERIESVGDLVIAELADLTANGPTEREFRGAFAQVEEAYGFVDNNSFMEEMLNDAIWPDREMQDYLDQYGALADVTADTVQRYISDHIRADQYIQVAVVPR